MSNPLPIPSYLKNRPRCNSYPSPPDVKIIARIKRPLPPIPPTHEKYKRNNSFPEPKNHKENSQRKSF